MNIDLSKFFNRGLDPIAKENLEKVVNYHLSSLVIEFTDKMILSDILQLIAKGADDDVKNIVKECKTGSAISNEAAVLNSINVLINFLNGKDSSLAGIDKTQIKEHVINLIYSKISLLEIISGEQNIKKSSSESKVQLDNIIYDNVDNKFSKPNVSNSPTTSSEKVSTRDGSLDDMTPEFFKKNANELSYVAKQDTQFKELIRSALKQFNNVGNSKN